MSLYKRVLTGHICGDCFGAPFEFQDNAPDMVLLSLGQCRYLDPTLDVGNKRWRQPGLHTDDTQQALMALDIAKRGEDPETFLLGCLEFAAARGIGAHRGTGRNFRQALFTGKPVDTAGLGAAMRVGPVTAFLAGSQEPEYILDWVRRLSLTTTTNPIGVTGALFYAAAILDRALGTTFLVSKNSIAERWDPVVWDLYREGLDVLQRNPNGFLAWAQPYSNRPLRTPIDGFALTGVLWTLYQTWESDHSEASGYEDALRRALSVPGDSDTIGAMVGGLAAVFHEPPAWMGEQLVAKEHLFEWYPTCEWAWTMNEQEERKAREVVSGGAGS